MPRIAGAAYPMRGTNTRRSSFGRIGSKNGVCFVSGGGSRVGKKSGGAGTGGIRWRAIPPYISRA